jgi:hypothetical protein
MFQCRVSRHEIQHAVANPAVVLTPRHLICIRGKVGTGYAMVRANLRSPQATKEAFGLISWSQDELAAKASVSLSTVRDFEKGRRVPIANNLTAMRVALETAGIEFVDNAKASGISFSKRKRR